MPSWRVRTRQYGITCTLVGLGLASVALLIATPLCAQDLRSTITELFTFGDCGAPLCLELGDEHGNHFIPAVTAGNETVIAFLTEAIGRAASSTPISATSSGATYTLVGGLPVRSSTSAGPIFAERAQTLGRGRFYLGSNLTGQQFTSLNGAPMDAILINFAHQDVGNPGEGDPEFENDVIQLTMNLDMSITVASLIATYGITDFIDLGLAVPFVRTSFTGSAEAQILPFGPSPLHRFGGTIDDPILRASTSAAGNASGLGDVVGRVKINVGQSNKYGAAILTDVRFPTGDEENLLGSGTTSVRALGVASAQFGSFAPHINVGYLARGGEFQSDAVVARLGFDNLMAPWATFAAELLSEWQVGETKIQLPGEIIFVAPFERRLAAISIPQRRDDILNAAMGFKFNVRGPMVVVTNVTFPLLDSGLQPDYFWTVGLEASW